MGTGKPKKPRFIPAYAGNTRCSSTMSSTPPVHPRIRGEHLLSGQGGWRDPGSSPHTRGTPDSPSRQEYPTRFIPAYAGNTAPVSPLGPRLPVHPRIRGEHRARTYPGCPSPGSSPHTRGTLLFCPEHGLCNRFIPAYAGNTRSGSTGRWNTPVHPRIRGEHCVCFISLLINDGSSPHTRGTRQTRYR